MKPERIRAIETAYKGYRFRSRLEARWAVFFDAIGLRWRYEVQGYEFPNGIRYLPDFHIPDWDIFFEVKPDLPFQEILWDGKTPAGFRLTDGEGKPNCIAKFLSGDEGLKELVKAGEGEAVKRRLCMLCGTPGLPSMRLYKGVWRLDDGAVILSPMPVPCTPCGDQKGGN